MFKERERERERGREGERGRESDRVGASTIEEELSAGSNMRDFRAGSSSVSFVIE